MDPPERVRQLPNPYRVRSFCCLHSPRLSLRSNLGLELANAFGVITLTAQSQKADYYDPEGLVRPSPPDAMSQS